MDPTLSILIEIQSRTNLSAKIESYRELPHAYLDRNGFFDVFDLFIYHFNVIPNFIPCAKIDCNKANTWFLEIFRTEIKDCHYNKRYHTPRKAELDEIVYFLFDDLCVYFNIENSSVKFLYRKTNIDLIDKIISGIEKFHFRGKIKKEISLIFLSKIGLMTKTFDINKPKFKIEDNYNDDFKLVHQTIYKRLSTKNDKGLVILYGKPGTGKSNYIRYLISSLKKDVIFLPPNMARDMTNPDLIAILIDNPNSIFVIEDAEKIVVDRDRDGSSPVSALLNISDGLLADCLNIQVICSFNTDISKVDSALMRKGRLIANYEFKELNIPKANALSKKLGFETEYNSPMTLTSIYNQREMDFTRSNKSKVLGYH
jgi:hypothetical protein